MSLYDIKKYYEAKRDLKKIKELLINIEKIKEISYNNLGYSEMWDILKITQNATTKYKMLEIEKQQIVNKRGLDE
jgi:hypothetical protein